MGLEGKIRVYKDKDRLLKKYMIWSGRNSSSKSWKDWLSRGGGLMDRACLELFSILVLLNGSLTQ